MKKRIQPHIGQPIRRRVLTRMGVLILVQIVLLTVIMYATGIIQKLDENAADILTERVINRKSYLESEMINRWSNVDLTVDQVNHTAAAMIGEGSLDISRLEGDPDVYTPFITAIADDLIAMMRANSVTGAFVVLSTSDLSADMQAGTYQDKPGIYIRDLDPLAQASAENTDLLLERSPIPVAQQLDISTDSAWRPRFDFSKNGIPYDDFFYQPYQNARIYPALSYKDLGYWSKPYTLPDDERQAVSYSVPLMLEDGTVYGVLGIELTIDHLTKLLPYDELTEGKNGSYVLAVAPEESLTFENLLISGPIYRQIGGEQTELSPTSRFNNCYLLETKSGEAYGTDLYGSVQYFNLYNSNTPFSDQQWALIGVMRGRDLFAFSNKINMAILGSILVALLTGVLGIFIVSIVVTKPITSLVASVRATPSDATVTLERTHIREVDELASSIEHMSEEVFDYASKFTKIIEMASVRMGAFEVSEEVGKDTFFITENFFRVFGVNDVDVRQINKQTFSEQMARFTPQIQSHDEENHEVIY